MRFKLLFYCLAVTVMFVHAGFSQMLDRMAIDDAITDELRRDGTKYETKRAILWVEKGGLTEQEIREFAELFEQGIVNVEKYTGIKFDKKHFQAEKLEYFINSKPGISRGYFGKKPFIYLQLFRVKEKRAPYVHEIVHKVVHQSMQAFWLQEGYASFVQTAVVARYGGYDKTASNPDGKDVHQLARNALKTDAAKIVLPLIGVNGTPSKLTAERREPYRPILEDRVKTAPVFYNLSISFVTFLVSKVGLKKLQKTFASPDTNAEILKITGRNTADWKADWLRSLAE